MADGYPEGLAQLGRAAEDGLPNALSFTCKPAAESASRCYPKAAAAGLSAATAC